MAPARERSNNLGVDPAISTISIESEGINRGSSEVDVPDPNDELAVRKKRRRRKKNREKSETTDYLESEIVKSIKMLESDVVVGTDSTRGKALDHQNIMQSIPVGKVFVENDRGFKAVSHLAIPSPLENEQSALMLPQQRLLELAISADRWMHSFAFICRGLLGGMSLCYIILVVQTSPPQMPWTFFIEHSACHSQIFHSIWCFLLAVCTVSTLDRIDVTAMSERRLWSIFDTGFISALIYSVSLCIYLSIYAKQEKIIFYTHKNVTEMWTHDGGMSEMETWRTCSLAVNSATVIGWLVVGIRLQPDDLLPYLES